MHASHEALTLHSPVAHLGSPWLTLLARCECLKRHGLGEREGELGADFTSIVLPNFDPFCKTLLTRFGAAHSTSFPSAHFARIHAFREEVRNLQIGGCGLKVKLEATASGLARAVACSFPTRLCARL